MTKIALCIGIGLLAVVAFYVGRSFMRQRAERREDVDYSIPNFLRGDDSQSSCNFVGSFEDYMDEKLPGVRFGPRKNRGSNV